jgi:hypothetical protein
MKGACIFIYQRYLIEPHLERAGLFQVMQQKYNCATVLYPGCFVHITPSFFFPHVIYIDRKEEASKFFSAESEVADFIRQHKQYKRSAYVRFILQDFLLPLPIPENSFDLLIAFYAGGVTQACKRYVRPGGLVLTNNHHDDAGQAARDPELNLISVVQRRGDTYKIASEGLGEYFVKKDLPSDASSYIQPGGGGTIEYIRTAEAYIFQKAAY